MTRKDDHRARGRALLIAAMNSRSPRRRRGLPTWLEDHQLVAKDHQFDFGVRLFVGRATDRPDYTAHNR